MKITKEGYVIMTPTISGDVLAWHVEDEGKILPDIYNTEKEARKALADNLIQNLQKFIIDEREWEEIVSDEYVAAYQEYEDGSFIVYDEFVNPIIESTLEQWRKEL